MVPEITRAYKVALDPNQLQLEQFARHAGAARAAFNKALQWKVAAHRLYAQVVADYTYTTFAGLAPEAALVAARKQVKADGRAAAKRRKDWLAGWKSRHIADLVGLTARQVSLRANQALKIAAETKPSLQPSEVGVPSAFEVKARWQLERGDETNGIDGCMPWWRSVSSYAFSSAFADADRAWSNWLDSLAGKRRGRRVGYPRFKAKGRSRDSFRIHHDVKNPTIRVDDARHLRIPAIGVVRMQGNLRRLVRKQHKGLVRVQSVTVSRHGHRWWALVLVSEQFEPRSASRRQKQAGPVGVDLGTHHLAALSTGQILDNPRHLRIAAAKLAKAQQALARTQKGSNVRRKAAARVGRIHAQVAEQRGQYLHQITKQLVTKWDTVCLETLNVAGMTASARGTVEEPGRQVRQKAGLNRSILDAAFGEFARQVEYKAGWYGAKVERVGQWEPTSSICSACRSRLPKLTLADRTITCPDCGFVCDRDLNAARNILTTASHQPHKFHPDGGGPTIRVPAIPKPAPGPRRHRRRPTPTTSGDPEANIGMLAEPGGSATAGPGVDAGSPPGAPLAGNGQAFQSMREPASAGHSP